METIIGKFAFMSTQRMYEIKNENGKKIGQFYITHDEKGNIEIKGSDVTPAYIFAHVENIIETDTWIIESTEYPDGYLDVSLSDEFYIEDGVGVPMPISFYEPSEDEFIEYINYNSEEIDILGVSATIDADALGYLGIFDECYENWKTMVICGEIETDTEFFTFYDTDCMEWMDNNHQHVGNVILSSNGIHEIETDTFDMINDIVDFIHTIQLKTIEGTHVWDTEIYNGLLAIINGHNNQFN